MVTRKINRTFTRIDKAAKLLKFARRPPPIGEANYDFRGWHVNGVSYKDGLPTTKVAALLFISDMEARILEVKAIFNP